ncbi:MAG: hypothetical protein R3B53_00420 [Candidatus Paceibacterota bacterium]
MYYGLHHKQGKTAMQEGFSGREVGGIVKVIISFIGNNLSDRICDFQEDDLWETKPHTASFAGGEW